MSHCAVLAKLTFAMAIAFAPSIGAAHTPMLTLSPKPATSPDETHAALALLSAGSSGELTIIGSVRTVRQLRSGSPPNAWECAWIVWGYRDPNHFYYLALKPNGWELGKRDPAYRGGQRFLATGGPKLPIGRWISFKIRQAGNQIQAEINSKTIITFSDDQVPVYDVGKVGVYTEDARVAVRGFRFAALPMADKPGPSQTVCADGAAAGLWTFPFLGYGCAVVTPKG